MNIFNPTDMTNINDIPFGLPEIPEPPSKKTEKDIETISNAGILVINNSSCETSDIEKITRKYIQKQNPKTLTNEISFCRTNWSLPKMDEITKIKELAHDKVSKFIFIIDQNKKIAKEYIDSIVFGKKNVDYEILSGNDVINHND